MIDLNPLLTKSSKKLKYRLLCAAPQNWEQALCSQALWSLPAPFAAHLLWRSHPHHPPTAAAVQAGFGEAPLQAWREGPALPDLSFFPVSRMSASITCGNFRSHRSQALGFTSSSGWIFLQTHRSTRHYALPVLDSSEPFLQEPEFPNKGCMGAISADAPETRRNCQHLVRAKSQDFREKKTYPFLWCKVLRYVRISHKRIC